VNKVKIGDLLTRVKESIDIEEDKQYKRVTIKTNNQGIYLRDIKFGRNIGTKKQFIIHAGQFLLSKIDARNGAFGIVPNDLDGAIITGNFWAYEVNHKLLNIEWFNLFVSSPKFLDICDRASSGTTNRRYLDENKFLNFEISLPSINEQNCIVEYFKSIKQKYDLITLELSYQQDLINRLRQSILQEAVQGKLVPQDPNDEPASVLLEKIKEEKERLVKEGKIKKAKPLPPITEDEIPYELPKGWVWVRLGEYAQMKNGISKRNGKFGVDFPVIRLADISNFKVCDKELRCITLTEEEIENYKVKYNDVLIIRVNGSRDLVGKAVSMKLFKEMAYCDHLMRVDFIGDINRDYFCYMFNSNVVRKSIENKITTTAGQNTINQGNLSKIIIPIPPLNEQQRIVQKVDQLMALCDELEKNIEQSKKDSELLMQSVLQEAFKEA